jgi:hypothetical protein
VTNLVVAAVVVVVVVVVVVFYTGSLGGIQFAFYHPNVVLQWMDYSHNLEMCNPGSNLVHKGVTFLANDTHWGRIN